MPDIASMVHSARSRAGLSQAVLAKRAGTSQPALARYERGTALPTLPTLERLLGACGEQLELRSVGRAQRSTSAISVRGQLGDQAQRLRRNRRRLLDAARTHGVRRVRVFGSLTRGEATPESDIDLLVDLKPGRTLLDLAAFRQAASEILETPVDAATPDMLKDRFRAQVMNQALPL